VIVHNKAGDKVGELTGATFAQFCNEQAKLHGGGKIGVAIQSEGGTSLITNPRELSFLAAGEYTGELLSKAALPLKRAEAWKVV